MCALRHKVSSRKYLSYFFSLVLTQANDNYDSLKPHCDSDDIIIPFKNLINEQYLRDISLKIRSTSKIKRDNGDFIAAYAPFGYKKDENNKHKLIIDQYASGIVRDIFNLKIKGFSSQNIASFLNNKNIPSPAEYRKIFNGKIFHENKASLWSAVTIGRILNNPVYIGTMIQGKQSRINFRLKKRIFKPENEWSVVSNTHQPVINKNTFEIVQDLLNYDTRTPPGQKNIYPLSGMVFCACCGNNFVRSKSGGYNYYICASNKEKKVCLSHAIKINSINNAVLEALKWQIVNYITFNKLQFSHEENIKYKIFAQFVNAVHLNDLSRALIVSLIKRIEIFQDNRILLKLRYCDNLFPES